MITQGMLIADRYEILNKIGAGGMSDVYKAKDLTLGRFVAIKVLKEEFNEDRGFVSKFRTEAQSAAGLEHPNIVNIYDVGGEQGLYYIVMEYVEGITLKDFILKKQKLNYNETLSIAIQVARGIEAAHAKGIVHRDIKPQNIIISVDGKVKVTDFGIAKAASENTIHSDIMGSVHYSSPEQARNGYVGEKSDIYSLGIVMYEMVTGKLPFDGESTVAIAIQHLQEEMVNPREYTSDMPISLEKIILKCTQKSVDRRYNSMSELLEDLRHSLTSPNEDFVTASSVTDSTHVISEEEVNDIKNRTAGIPVSSKEETKEPEWDESEYEDEDEQARNQLRTERKEKTLATIGIAVAVAVVVVVLVLLASVFGLIHFGGSSSKQPSAQTENSKQTMIDLRGMTVSQAKDKLEDMGITLEEAGIKPSNEYDKGQIISQDISEGTTIKKGDTVKVYVSSGASAEKVTVPDVKGKTYTEAQSVLEDAKFVVKKTFEYSADVDMDKVIRQTPNAGTKAKEGSTITIVVSQGAKRVSVPDVTDMTLDQAKAALKKAELEVGTIKKQTSDTVDKGKVISQSTVAGTYASAGDKVNLVISEGSGTASYSFNASLTAPSGYRILYAYVELTASESDQVLKSWGNVRTFPLRMSVKNITAAPQGVLTITWHYKDGDGKKRTFIQEKTVSFKRE